MPDMTTDNISAVFPIGKINFEGETPWTDFEEQKHKSLTMTDYVKALELLCQQVGKTLFVGGIKSPSDLIDAGNWDAEVVDAFYQLAFHGEVIYG